MSEKHESQWGIVELMGHKVVAGRVSKDEMLGKPMLRVDVPATSAYPEFTQFYGESAIYCVTFTSEEVARHTAESCQVNPVSVYTPELITVERHREEMNKLREIIERLRSVKGLPSGEAVTDRCDGCPYEDECEDEPETCSYR